MWINVGLDVEIKTKHQFEMIPTFSARNKILLVAV